MNIEIVECYPIKLKKKADFAGSLHVYLIDYGIDLRGAIIIKNKNHWIIKMPYKTGIDQETGEYVSYPIFSFTDREKGKSLLNEIKKKAIEYIEENILKEKVC